MSSNNNNNKLYIGVDGGGTKTRFICCIDKNNNQQLTIATSNIDLPIVCDITLNGCNPNSVGDVQANNIIIQGIEQCLTQFNNNNDNGKLYVASITAVIAGCNNDNDAKRIHNWIFDYIKQYNSDAVINVYNDAYGALYSGRTYNGIVCISGTGFIVLGVNNNSNSSIKQHICGGNGCPVDSGSSYAVGLDVIRACFNDNDGTGQYTSMKNILLQQLNMKYTTDLIDWLYRDYNINNWSSIGRLAKIATKCAIVNDENDNINVDNIADYDYNITNNQYKQYTVNDQVAYNIVEKHCNYITHNIITALTKLYDLNNETITIVLSGGLLSCQLVFEKVVYLLRSQLQQYRLHITRPIISPAYGAALHSYKMYNNIT